MPPLRKQLGYAALPPSTAAPTSLRTSALEHFEEINVFSSRDCSASDRRRVTWFSLDSNVCSGSVLFCSDQLLVLNLELAIYAPRS